MCAIIISVAVVELHNEVSDWLAALTDADWQRTAVIIDRLEVVGPAARMPLSHSLGDGLFELRFALGPTARRITYRFTKTGGSCCSRPSASNATTNDTRSTEPAAARLTARLATREGDDDGELLPLG